MFYFEAARKITTVHVFLSHSHTIKLLRPPKYVKMFVLFFTPCLSFLLLSLFLAVKLY